MILNKAPKANSKRQVRKPIFPDVDDLTMPYKDALILMKKHIDLREKFDELTLEINEDDMIYYEIDETNTSLEIYSGYSSTVSQNILIAINPFELGIEAVAIVKCKLNLSDYILDGEVIEPRGGILELVRMPVALISHDYLRKAFDIDAFKLEYDGHSQSSIKREDIPRNDIIIFDWDLFNRREIINNKKLGVGTEVDRYNKWERNFGNYFRYSALNQFNQSLGLFTPSSAKIASYYFAQND